MEERRTWKESYFWIFVFCIVFTLVSDYYNISVDQMTGYADAFLKRAFNNMNSLIIWIFPVLLMIKREVAMWRQTIHDRDIEIAKINAPKCEVSDAKTNTES